MKIKKLYLENFRGIKNLQVDFTGSSTDIFGANGTGKTTVANAIAWLLTDSPATGEKDFTPKTADSHHLEHRAVVELEMDGGELVRLGKTFHEVWKKKRGSAAPEFSGHATDYSINDVPAKKKEFDEMLTRITGGDAERAKMLLLAGYFAESMKDEERRKILFEVCGDVDDSTVLDEVPDLREFLLIPGGDGNTYSPEERKKIAVKERQGYNKKLTELPARIDELSRSLPEDNDSNTPEDIKLAIKAKQEQLNELKAGYKSETRRATLKAVLAGIEAEEKAKLKNFINAKMEAEKKASEEATALLVKCRNLESTADEMRYKIRSLAEQIAQKTAERKGLLRDFDDIKAEQWNDEDGYCPTCKREYEPEKLERLKEDFLESRAKRLAKLNTKGQNCSAKVIAGLKAELEQLEVAEKKAQSDAEEARWEFEQAKGQVTISLTVFEKEFAATDEGLELKDKRERVIMDLEAIQDDDRSGEEMLQAELEKLIFDLGKVQQAEETTRRISELEQEKLDAAAGLEQAERVIFLCEEFTRAKVRMVTDRINAKFTGVRWLLFREQINGGLKECCEPLIPNAQGDAVEYRSANTAAQVNAGLEIIQVLAQHYGTQLPVIVDRAESVCELRKIDGQIIRLIVSAEDKNLRISNQD